MAKKTISKRKPVKAERKVSEKSKDNPKHKEFRKGLDLDYTTARLVKQMRNSVSFYVEDKNSGNDVLVCENIDKLDKVHPDLRDLLEL